VRFASVYRSFEDLSAFQEILAEVGPKRSRKTSSASPLRPKGRG